MTFPVANNRGKWKVESPANRPECYLHCHVNAELNRSWSLCASHRDEPPKKPSPSVPNWPSPVPSQISFKSEEKRGEKEAPGHKIIRKGKISNLFM